jgi:tetratricopeptide (TPR) repeat protein
LLEPGRPEFDFGRGVTEEALGHLARAVALIAPLAPVERSGYAPAHRWLAQHLLGPAASSQATRVAELHLRRALEAEPEDATAHATLGQLLLATGKAGEAEVHLLKALPYKPELDLPLAQLYAARGSKELVQLHAERALRYFRERARNTVDDWRAHIAWSESTLLLGDFAGAAGILKESLHLTNKAQYRPALARVYLAWFDARSRDEKAPFGERLALIEQAVLLDFGNPTALERVLALTKGPAEQTEKVRAALQGMLAEGKSPLFAHMALGLEARGGDRMDEARRHFERAFELAPQAPLVLNNMAWVLSLADPPDLPRALDLIETALKQAPGQLNFRETRGQILAKMGKWKEALPDLEAALPALRGNKELHTTLAKVYEELGMKEMAKEHARRAEGDVPIRPKQLSPESPK